MSNKFVFHLPMEKCLRRKIVVEKGKFVMYVQNRKQGHMLFNWKKQGKYTQLELLDMMREQIRHDGNPL